MMTPSQFKEHEFKNAGRNAYKSKDVDEFFAEVLASYEKMFRENGELVKRVSMLADRLEKYKNDENDIKTAVISAQKAADLIVKDAENSIADSKAEAEAILSAAKGEAEIIKSDAEKQAVADADLILSVTKDKAQEIIKKAKEEAHGIIINANSSASDKVGAATRTITSETILFDMMKKEVSEFKASILSQYKAHIELISKLPELAAEEAEKKAENEPAPEVKVEYDEQAIESFNNDASNEDAILEYVTDDVPEEEAPENLFEAAVAQEESEDGEQVVKTTLPFDFFSDDSTLEFVDGDEAETIQPEADSITDTDESSSDEVIEPSFKIDIGHLNFDVSDIAEDVDVKADDEEQAEDTAAVEENETTAEDISISGGFSFDSEAVSGELETLEKAPSKFAKIKVSDSAWDDEDEEETDNDDDEDDGEHKKRHFFKRKK